MNGSILLWDGSTVGATADSVKDAHAQDQPFWLDFCGLTDDELACLRDEFKIHPLALDDVRKFGQRPKFEPYDEYVHIVIYGAVDQDSPSDDGVTGGPATPATLAIGATPATLASLPTPAAPGAAPAAAPPVTPAPAAPGKIPSLKPEETGSAVEVHAFYCEKFLITIHREDLPVFDQVRTHASVVRQHGQGVPVFLLYRVIEGLVDGFFPVLDRFDDRIDAMEDDILVNPTDEQLGVLFDMKRSLVSYRKVVTPQRDVFAGIAAGALELPGMTEEAERYYRDLYDHLIRISDLVDSYRDLLSSAVDTHLSVVSNRLNVVMKQLAVIATIFLPLSYLTGFFGQNFNLLVNHFLLPAWTFWVIGLGTEVLAVLGLYALFKKRQWI